MLNKKILIATAKPISQSRRANSLLEMMASSNELAVLSPDTNSMTDAVTHTLVYRSLSGFDKKSQALAKSLGWISLVSVFSERQLTLDLSKNAFNQFDVIFVLDLMLLPLFKSVLGRVIFDGSELDFDHVLTRHYLKKYVVHTPFMISDDENVSQSLADIIDLDSLVLPPFPLEKNWTVQEIRIPLVNLDKTRIIALATTSESASRIIEVSHLLHNRFHVYLMLEEMEQRELGALIKKSKGVSQLTILPPVKDNDSMSHASSFDVALVLEIEERQSASNAKFFGFDCLAAGLPLIANTNTLLGRWVEDNDAGVVVKEELAGKELAQAINVLSPALIATQSGNATKSMENNTFDKFFNTLLTLVSRRL